MTVAILDPPKSPAGVASPSTIFAGVDTHKDTHHVSIVDGLGRPIADREFLAVGSGTDKSSTSSTRSASSKPLVSKAPVPTAPNSLGC